MERSGVTMRFSTSTMGGDHAGGVHRSSVASSASDDTTASSSNSVPAASTPTGASHNAANDAIGAVVVAVSRPAASHARSSAGWRAIKYTPNRSPRLGPRLATVDTLAPQAYSQSQRVPTDDTARTLHRRG